MPEINTTLPPWLADRSFWGSNPNAGKNFIQGFQWGAENARQNRALALQERAAELKVDAELGTREGLIELGQVVSEIAKSGDWTSPENRSRFYATAAKHPHVMKSEAFKSLEDNFQLAERAKQTEAMWQIRTEASKEIADTRAIAQLQAIETRLNGMMQLEGVRADHRQDLEVLRGDIRSLMETQRQGGRSDLETQRQGGRSDLEAQRQGGRSDLEAQRQQGRLEVIDAKSNYDQILEDAKQSHRQENITLKSAEDIRRDALKPKTYSPKRFDLPNSVAKQMSEELEGLKIRYREGLKHAFSEKDKAAIESTYKRDFDAISEKYKALRLPAEGDAATPTAPAPSTAKPVLKYNPTTRTFE